MLEENFRRALLMSEGSFNIFVRELISASLLALIVLFVAWQSVAFFVKRRRTVAAARSPSASA